jgi:hypothetical protein
LLALRLEQVLELLSEVLLATSVQELLLEPLLVRSQELP